MQEYCRKKSEDRVTDLFPNIFCLLILQFLILLFLTLLKHYASSIAFPISWRIYLFANVIHSVAS